MEIGSTVREVKAFDDPGPRAGGNFMTNDVAFEDEMLESLKRQFKGKEQSYI